MKKYWAIWTKDPPVILGRRLKRLTLGHRYLLRIIKSPFLIYDGWISLTDLLFAVIICSYDYNEACLLIKDEKRFKKTLKRWYRLYSLFRFIYKLLGVSEPSIEERVKTFYDYLNSDNKPFYKFEEEETKSIECPEELFVKVYLQKHLGYSENEVMNKTWDECIWEVVLLQSMEGNLEMLDENDFNETLKKGQELIKKLKQDGRWLKQ